MILIFGDEQRWAAMSPAEQQAHDGGHVAFRIAAGSAIVGGEELEAATIATTLRAPSPGGCPR